MTPIILDAAPSILSLYKKVVSNMLVRRSRPTNMPDLSVKLDTVRTAQSVLIKYMKVCGFKNTRQLPITYPHILAFPLQMTLLVNDAFPFPLLGLVHICNKIIQHRVIATDEPLNFCCRINTQRKTVRGIEFDILTSAYVNQELVWESTSTMLYRNKSKATAHSKKLTTIQHFSTIESWLAPNDIGRRYAKVSGDRNPIHLFALAAKLFGFKQHIAHGMWSKARCLAQIEDKLGNGYCQVDVKFKRPLFLPAEVNISYQQEGDQISFELSDIKNENQHLTGEVSLHPSL